MNAVVTYGHDLTLGAWMHLEARALRRRLPLGFDDRTPQIYIRR